MGNEFRLIGHFTPTDIDHHPSTCLCSSYFQARVERSQDPRFGIRFDFTCGLEEGVVGNAEEGSIVYLSKDVGLC